MKVEEINELLRRVASEIIPEFNQNEWFANEINSPGSNIFGVLSMLRGLSYGKYRFVIDIPQRLSYSGNLYVFSDYQRQGLGRKLVKFREKVCKEAGIEKVIINNNENPSFWNHFGYNPLSDSQRLDLTMFNKIEFREDLENPMYKDLK